jgi:hypothetical protein
MDSCSSFLVSILVAYSLFKLHLPFDSINFFEKEKSQRLLSGSIFGFKARTFLLFELENCSAISRVVVVLVTGATPHVASLKILRILAYTTDKKISNYLLVLYRER